MAEEYSYFRVAGKTRDLVEQVDQSRQFIKDENNGLCAKFNASMLSHSIDLGNLSLTIDSFLFVHTPVPQGWDVVREESRTGDPKDKEKMYQALPAKNSADADYIEERRQAMEVHVKTYRLENVLGSGEMPRKSLPAGYYDNSFVKKTEIAESSTRKQGFLTDHFTCCTYSSGAVISSDPLDYMKLDEEYYLRVPNDVQGNPVYMPPDSELVDLADMQALDKEEHFRQKGIEIK